MAEQEVAATHDMEQSEKECLDLAGSDQGDPFSHSHTRARRMDSRMPTARQQANGANRSGRMIYYVTINELMLLLRDDLTCMA